MYSLVWANVMTLKKMAKIVTATFKIFFLSADVFKCCHSENNTNVCLCKNGLEI